MMYGPWFWMASLCMTLAGEPCQFPTPIRSQDTDGNTITFATDRECVVALIRTVHLYEIFYDLWGITIKRDRCVPVHWDINNPPMR